SSHKRLKSLRGSAWETLFPSSSYTKGGPPHKPVMARRPRAARVFFCRQERYLWISIWIAETASAAI
ncbi:hypothetical protein, partial [uncultured Desulfovibrio sp.]|uniref:hypothetical protein n=1 Tax=uncultured Desulfovibrio sp. TaxID=167968 RepID=UPI00260F4F38